MTSPAYGVAKIALKQMADSLLQIIVVEVAGAAQPDEPRPDETILDDCAKLHSWRSTAIE